MQRIVVIVAVLYVLWRVLTALGRRVSAAGKGSEDFSRFSVRSRDRRKEAKQRQTANVELIACANCGTFVPGDRALTAGKGVVCCSPQCVAVLDSNLEMPEP